MNIKCTACLALLFFIPTTGIITTITTKQPSPGVHTTALFQL